MNLASADLLARLSLFLSPDAILAFDADGTLWSGDVAEDALAGLLAHDAILPPGAAALRAFADARKIPVPDDVRGMAHAVFEADVAGLFPHIEMCEVMAMLYAGRTPEDAVAFVAAALEERKLRARLQREVWAVIDWARERGVAIAVVSASPLPVVQAAVRVAGLAPAFVVGVTTAIEGGLLTGEIVRPIPYAEGKVHNLRAVAGDRPIIAAFGDSAFDAALLRAARLPVAVRPKPKLRTILGEIPDVVELSDEGYAD